MRLSERAAALAERALALLYPRRAVCMGCGEASGCDRDWLCADCRKALARRWVGARPVAPGGGIDGAAFAFYYEGPAGGMVRRLKYHGVYRLAEPMAAAMARAERALEPTAVDWVVPVPMHPRRLRARGFNHAEKLAEGVARALEVPCVNALTRRRDTPQQARLSDEERRENLKDAFAANRPLEGRRVLLVDDVYTTGATARGCARALLEGGAKNVYVLCFALAERDGGQYGQDHQREKPHDPRSARPAGAQGPGGGGTLPGGGGEDDRRGDPLRLEAAGGAG